MFTSKLLTFLLILALSSPLFAHQCGSERWAVKTLAVPSQVDPLALPMRISDLVAIPPPSRKILKASITRFPSEKVTAQVVGRLVGFKLEDDGDFHIVIQDLYTRTTMVIEIPHPGCVSSNLAPGFASLRASFEKQYGKATPDFKTVKLNHYLQVTGPLFFDFIHGQRGVAKNGIEIHPVMTLRELPVLSCPDGNKPCH